MIEVDETGPRREISSRTRRAAARGLAIAIAAAISALAATGSGAAPADAGDAEAPAAVAVEISGMTFVASRDDDSELRVRADEAWFRPDERTADLAGVHATVRREGSDETFEVRCERGTLDLDTRRFRASGDVRGRTDDGREFETEWVRYDHVAGMLSTRAPVVITDSGITYRGGGFDYDVEGQRFTLLGGASVVQDP